MYGSGHMGAALLLYAPLGRSLVAVDASLAIAGGAVAVALARLPDVDRRLPLVAHRGITHTPAFVAVVAVGACLAGHLLAVGAGFEPARWGTGIGAATATSLGSHLVADALTPRGVPLLWPVSRRRVSAGLVRADDPACNFALLVVGITVTLGVVRGAGWI